MLRVMSSRVRMINFRSFMSFADAKRMLPKVSETERAALQCGTISIDRDIYSGKMNYKKLMAYKPSMSVEEKKFIENDVNEVCNSVVDYDVMKRGDLSGETWELLKKRGFFSFIIPKEYGGKKFGYHAHSQIVQKLATSSSTLGTTVMVPNSLGPAELLKKYGTDEQKDLYLPRLADGREIPCFALTGIRSGSDAASMWDFGDLVENENGELEIEATFSKRYITLAPVASLVGLAFILRDPNGLMEKRGIKGKEGITLALLPRETKGLVIGPRHDPLGGAFMNGVVQGDRVRFSVDRIIGGIDQSGFGWNMLMECLGEGRGLSLPAASMATAKLSLATTGAYARIRRQFKTPLAEMEGVQEKLADMTYQTTVMMAGQHLMNAILDNGEKPSVLSAVVKQQATERGRIVINHAMDIVGGAAICWGPQNYLATAYMMTPVGITVEGSNTLTRSLIIFGQGLMRSHPYLYPLVQSIEADNKEKYEELLSGFILFSGWRQIQAMVRNMISVILPKKSSSISLYKWELARITANFATYANSALLMGKKFKTAEMISGRFADVFSSIFYANALLLFRKNNRNVDGIDKLVSLCIRQELINANKSLIEIRKNMEIMNVKLLMGLTLSGLPGLGLEPLNDNEKKWLANQISRNTEIRQLLIENIYVSDDESNKINILVKKLSQFEAAELLEKRKEKNNLDKEFLNKIENIRDFVIGVDHFTKLK